MLLPSFTSVWRNKDYGKCAKCHRNCCTSVWRDGQTGWHVVADNARFVHILFETSERSLWSRLNASRCAAETPMRMRPDAVSGTRAPSRLSLCFFFVGRLMRLLEQTADCLSIKHLASNATRRLYVIHLTTAYVPKWSTFQLNRRTYEIVYINRNAWWRSGFSRRAVRDRTKTTERSHDLSIFDRKW